MSYYLPLQSTTIASSGTTSEAIDLGNHTDLICVMLPAAWTGCTLRVQVSHDNTTYYNLGGTSMVSATTAADEAHVFKVYGWQFVKLVCSTAQGGARTVLVRGIRE